MMPQLPRHRTMPAIPVVPCTGASNSPVECYTRNAPSITWPGTNPAHGPAINLNLGYHDGSNPTIFNGLNCVHGMSPEVSVNQHYPHQNPHQLQQQFGYGVQIPSQKGFFNMDGSTKTVSTAASLETIHKLERVQADRSSPVKEYLDLYMSPVHADKDATMQHLFDARMIANEIVSKAQANRSVLPDRGAPSPGRTCRGLATYDYAHNSDRVIGAPSRGERAQEFNTHLYDQAYRREGSAQSIEDTYGGGRSEHTYERIASLNGESVDDAGMDEEGFPYTFLLFFSVLFYS